YRPVLETSGVQVIMNPTWRDFAVFVSLSSRTNTRLGRRASDPSMGHLVGLVGARAHAPRVEGL
ncbi:hypothetical protein, partial [Rhodopseudomonas pseudopalustris]|uniref:hypothetical protein n=1 Tax=Rhodopseudomonas pseudopalustris TaxID=1513892 RepID=UPI001AECF099